MYVYQFSEEGASHALRGEGNQDACSVSECGEVAFAFMADGMGSASRGGEAARAAVKTAAALTPWTFLAGEPLREPSLRFSVRAAFPIAYNALLEAAAKTDGDTRGLLTTFMCAAYDARSLRLEYGFCGDGGIVALTEKGDVRLLTRPAKGAVPGSTTPLNSCESWLFGSCDNVRSFFMCTDGVFDRLCPDGALPQSKGLRKTIRQLLKQPGFRSPDQTRIVLDNAFSRTRETTDHLGKIMEGATDDRTFVLISRRKGERQRS